jgi:muramoyltetrapeptide carboxypeptidase
MTEWKETTCAGVMNTPLLFPPRLAVGDTIGLVAPASPPDEPEKIDEVIERLAMHGFKVKPGKFLRKRSGYLAGSDEERAGDFNALFADPGVKGIFALRGGYGSCRILPLLDYAAIRANPKPFVGYSDNTALHHAILLKSGLVTFHGPNAMEAFLPENLAICRRMLTEPLDPSGTLLFSRENAKEAGLKTIVPGHITGRLIGGNMTCLLRLIGTPYAPDFRDAILFLEDIGEKAYRVDGMFTHLRLAGILSQIRGLILGRFAHCDETERWRIDGCLQREAAQVGVPCISGAPIGHFPGQIIVPHGAQAELNADQALLRLVASK